MDIFKALKTVEEHARNARAAIADENEEDLRLFIGLLSSLTEEIADTVRRW